MEEEKMYVPSGLKTKDGKDIMCYTGAFYLKNKEKIERMVKKGEEILRDENKFSEKQQKDNAILLDNAAELRAKMEDLRNNIKLLTNNLTDENKELISDSESENQFKKYT